MLLATNDRPVLSSQMALRIDRTAPSDSNKTLILGPTRSLTPRLTDQLSVCRNVTLILTLTWDAVSISWRQMRAKDGQWEPVSSEWCHEFVESRQFDRWVSCEKVASRQGRKHGSCGIYIVEWRNLATANKTNREDLVCAQMRSRVREFSDSILITCTYDL
jgi:hypothetical protein